MAGYQIEAARTLLEHTPLSQLRAQARVRAVHNSSCIEGNRLTMAQAKAAIKAEESGLPAPLIADRVHYQFVALEPEGQPAC